MALNLEVSQILDIVSHGNPSTAREMNNFELIKG